MKEREKNFTGIYKFANDFSNQSNKDNESQFVSIRNLLVGYCMGNFEENFARTETVLYGLGLYFGSVNEEHVIEGSISAYQFFKYFKLNV